MLIAMELIWHVIYTMFYKDDVEYHPAADIILVSRRKLLKNKINTNTCMFCNRPDKFEHFL